ncbi:hypothetical protein D3C75_1008140 [compost metagenome]
MLGAAKLQSCLLQGAVQSDLLASGAVLELAVEQLLQVEMRQASQATGDLLPAPFDLELLAVVVAPAEPALQAVQVLLQPGLEARLQLVQGRGIVDVGLADMGELPAEGGELWAMGGADEALEMILLTTLLIDDHRADLDDFHVFDRPAAVIGGGFQVDYQPVLHAPLLSPCRSSMGSAYCGGKPLC